MGKPEVCKTHPDKEAAATCNRCDAGICRDCINEYGYYCSRECLMAARGTITPGDRQRKSQAAAEMAMGRRVFALLAGGVAVVVLGLLGWFIWRNFLDPAGDLAWERQFSAPGMGFGILAAADDQVLLHIDDRIEMVNPEDGSVIKRLDFEDFQGENDGLKMTTTISRIEVLDDGYLAMGPGFLRRLDKDAQAVYDIALPSGAQPPLLNADCTWAAGLARERLGDEWKFKTTFYGLDLSTGKVAWTRPLSEDTSIANIAVAKDTVAAVFTKGDKAMIVGFHAATGKNKWLKEVPNAPEWGPIAGSGLFCYLVGSTLYGVSTEGDWAWGMDGDAPKTFDVPASEWDASIAFRDGLLFIGTDDGTQCLDLVAGKKRWETGVSFDEDNLIVGDKYIYFMGALVEEIETADLSKMPGFNQDPGVLQDYGLDKSRTVEREIPVLLCLDRASGEAQWLVREARGRILGNDERLVRVMREGDSMLAVFKEDAETYLFQYKLGDGSTYYQKTHTGLAVGQAVLAGDHLVCFSVEGEEETGGGDVAQGWGAFGTKVSGRIVGFHLK